MEAVFQARPTDWLKSESDEARFSREAVIVKAGEKLVSGTVIGMGADGKVVAATAANVDSAPVHGIILDGVDATAGDKGAVAIVRDAVVDAGKLTVPADAALAATMKTKFSEKRILTDRAGV